MNTAPIDQAPDARPLDLFADHWENPEPIEAKLRAAPHETLAEYGVWAPPDLELRLVVNRPALFNLRVYLDIDARSPFWDLNAMSRDRIQILFSHLYCPVRGWCEGGLEAAFPIFMQLMERCREEPAFLEAFRTAPNEELTKAGIPIPTSWEVNVCVCDKDRQYIALLTPRGPKAAAKLRSQIRDLDAAHAAAATHE